MASTAITTQNDHRTAPIYFFIYLNTMNTSSWLRLRGIFTKGLSPAYLWSGTLERY